MNGVTLASLHAKSNRPAVKAVVNDITRLIDAQISTQHAAGFSIAEIELPANFDINGLSRYDSQVLIYSELIKIYQAKGWDSEDIGLRSLPGDRMTFSIRWLNGMDADERSERLDIIKQHMLKGGFRGPSKS